MTSLLASHSNQWVLSTSLTIFLCLDQVQPLSSLSSYVLPVPCTVLVQRWLCWFGSWFHFNFWFRPNKCTVVMSWLSYCCRLSWSFSHDTHVKFVQFVFTQNLLWRWLRTLKERGPRPQWSPSPPTGSGWSACPLGMSCSIFLQKKTSLFLIQLIFKAQNGYRYLLDRQTKCTFPRFKNYLVYVLILIWLPQLFIIHIVWLFDVALCRRQAVTNSANTFYATKRLIGRRCFSVLMDLIWNAIRRFLCFCFDFQLKNVLI